MWRRALASKEMTIMEDTVWCMTDIKLGGVLGSKLGSAYFLF
jgi:hypothetical protein